MLHLKGTSRIQGRTQCLQRILNYVFGNNNILYINFKEWSLLNNQAVIFDKYDQDLPYQNIAMRTRNLDMEKLISEFGYDKNVLLITNETVTNSRIIFLQTWFKYRTKVAIITFSSQTDQLVTNIHSRSTSFCPNMIYEEVRNICSKTPNAIKKKISAKRYCKLKVSYVKVHPFVNSIEKSKKEGIMVSWMRTFGEIRGFKVKFIKDNHIYQSEFLNNGTFHKLIADLVTGKQDVAIGQLFMNSSEEYPVDFGTVIYKDWIGFIHRKFLKISNFKRMFVVFNKNVWYCLTITFCIVVPIYYLVNYLMENIKLVPSVVLTDIFRVSLGSSIPLIPKSFSLRILFASFCMFGLTMNSLYVGKLIEVFTNPPSDLEEDLFGHGVRVHISYFIDRITCMSYNVYKRSDSRQHKAAGNSVVNQSDQELLKMVSTMKVLDQILQDKVVRV